MEKESYLEKTEKLLHETGENARYTEQNFLLLGRIMENYSMVITDLNTIAPDIFNNLATLALIDLTNRVNALKKADTEIERQRCYQDYHDYLRHVLQLTSAYIREYFPDH